MAKQPSNRPSQDQLQPYDTLLKSLLEGQEREILSYFFPGVEYLETLNIEVVRTPLRVDRVYKVKHKERVCILHVEFESGPNNDMAVRLLDYHAYLHRKYHIPVISIIVYPFPSKMAVPPLREMSGDQELLVFHFWVLPIWKLQAEQYLSEHAVAMYALLPTMEGANAQLLHKAIEEMVEYYKGDDTRLVQELRWMGIVLRRAKMPRREKLAVEERLTMWDDLFERDPKMRKFRKESEAKGLAEGLAEGKAKGLAEGKAQGLAEGLQKAVITAIKLRYPPLTEMAQERIPQINKPEVLNVLLDQISTVPDEATVRMLLDLIAA
jgi:predicted transposase YdaD